MTQSTVVLARGSNEKVHLVALKTLPYNRIRKPNEVFEAAKGYADLFVRQGMARLATPADIEAASATTRAITTSARTRRRARRSPE